MSQTFRSFVIFAEMRTGSNLLEATLNAVKGVTCFGEAFNPYMMGWPDKDELLGISRDQREAEPSLLLSRLLDKPGHLPGFRYFHDHDPRVFDAIMDRRDCAKIVLTRNPLDSYVSTRLAWETNQWKLNETETPIPARITYDGAEFRQMLWAMQDFRRRINHRLQTSGQTAFWLDYDDLRDAGAMTGLLHWLGRTELERVEPARDQVPQNPRETEQKVQNFDLMKADLQSLDPFALHHLPNFEPDRGPGVPGHLACEAGKGLIFMPIKGGPVPAVSDWMQALGPIGGDHSQSSLRQWKRAHPGHRGFTVLRHPLRRAWQAFAQLLAAGRADTRSLMRQVYRVPLPPDEALCDLSPDDSARLFADFLDFLRRNLNGQTSLPTHPGWASQSEIVAGLARFATPDMLIHEDRLPQDLGYLCRMAEIADPQLDRLTDQTFPDFLTDKSLLKAARAAYLRDYVTFGFTDPA